MKNNILNEIQKINRLMNNKGNGIIYEELIKQEINLTKNKILNNNNGQIITEANGEDPDKYEAFRKWAIGYIGIETNYPIIMPGIKFPVIYKPPPPKSSNSAGGGYGMFGPQQEPLGNNLINPAYIPAKNPEPEIDAYNNPAEYLANAAKTTPTTIAPKPVALPVKQFTSKQDFDTMYKKSGLKINIFKEGDKLDNNQVAPVGRRYLTIGKNKYCLPDENWENFHIGKKYVYSILNEKTNKEFSMALIFGEMKQDGATVSGQDASRRCFKGSSGWAWKMVMETNQEDPSKSKYELFYLKNESRSPTDKLVPYNVSEDAGTDSKFADWWNSGWGIAIEVAVGLLAAIFTAGASAALLAAARLGTYGVRLSRVIIALSEVSYFGGSTALLTPIVGSLLEATLMLPVVGINVMLGNETDAILGVVFCFIPFFSELPGIKRLVTTGKYPLGEMDIIGREIVNEMASAGGYRSISASQQATINFLTKLSPKAQTVYIQMMTDLSIKTNAGIAQKGLNLVIRENSDKIVTKMAKDTEVAKYVGMSTGKKVVIKTAKAVLNNANIITGKGIIPNLVRLGVPIMGFTFGFLNIMGYLKGKGVQLDPEKEEAFQLAIQKSIQENEYLVGLIKLNQDLGYGQSETQIQAQLDKSIEAVLENNPQMIEDIKNGKLNQDDFNEKLEIETKKTVSEYEEQYVSVIKTSVEDFRKNKKLIEIIDNIKENFYENPIFLDEVETKLNEKFKELGYEVESWNTDEYEYWSFVTKNKENGKLIFATPEKDTIIEINGKELAPSKG